MLDLGAPTRIVAGVELAGDSDDRWLFYVLPPPPRVATPAGDEQTLLLTRFVIEGSLAGGHLELVVEAAHDAAVLEAARSQLTEELHDTQSRVRLAPLPVTSASAELLFVGRDTDAQGNISALLARPYGQVTPVLEAPYRARFSVSLSAEGVQLIEAALRSGGAPVGVVYRLRCEGLRPGQEVVGHVDWSRVYQHFSSEWKEGNLFSVTDVQQLVERLREDRSITVRAVQAIAPDGSTAAPDIGPAIDWVTRELIEKCCNPVVELSREPAHASLGTLGDMFGVGARYTMKALVQTDQVSADLSIERFQVVTRTLTAARHLADLIPDGKSAEHIVTGGTESPFFQRAGLRLRTGRPLAESFVRELVAQASYGADEFALVLDAAHPEAAASTWADHAADHTWRLALSATLADDAPLDPGAKLTLAPLAVQSWDLLLDVDQLLGLRHIEVRGTPDERVAASRVTLRQLRGSDVRGEREATLTGAAPASGKTTVWFRDVAPGDRIEAVARHVLKDGRLLTEPPMAVETLVLTLPPPFPGGMTVQVMTDDSWGEVERIVVAIQKNAASPAGTLQFDKPGSAAAVRLDLPDPLDRSYRYQVTRMKSGGLVEQDDFRTDDHSVLLLGAFRGDLLVVDVTPVGLELPVAGVNVVEVQLQYVDAANQVRDTPTALIHALADTYHWEVQLKDPALRSYQYRVVVHRNNGQTQTGLWQTSSDRVLPIPITA